MEIIELENEDTTKLNVLDLFCGAGGWSSGFKTAGYNVTGIDYADYVEKTYMLNEYGKFKRLDLSTNLIKGNFDIIIGGPPCRPWSSVNTKKRKDKHESYMLVSQFFKMIEMNRPEYFLLENVPPLSNDKMFLSILSDVEKLGYSIKRKIIKYSDYGAPIGRHRLIAFGSRTVKAEVFFSKLEKYKSRNKTVREMIWYLRDVKMGAEPDHLWPNLKTIDKYKDKYLTNKYGWYILNWDRSAPSFGNIMKTYILHPDAFSGGEKRVISVKEASLILGYKKDFRFPQDIGIGAKYQMIADSVSPIFSNVAAKIITEIKEQKENGVIDKSNYFKFL